MSLLNNVKKNRALRAGLGAAAGGALWASLPGKTNEGEDLEPKHRLRRGLGGAVLWGTIAGTFRENKSTANFFMRNPLIARGAIGAGLGAAWGSVGGKNDEGEELTSGQRIRRVFGGAALGGTVGAASGGARKIIQDYVDEAGNVKGISDRAQQRWQKKQTASQDTDGFYSDPREAARKVEQNMRSGGYKKDLDDALSKGDYDRAEKLYQEAQSGLNDMTNSGMYTKDELKKLQRDLARNYHPDTYAAKRQSVNRNTQVNGGFNTPPNAPIRGQLRGSGFSYMGTVFANFEVAFDPNLGKEYTEDLGRRSMKQMIERGDAGRNPTVRAGLKTGAVGLLAGAGIGGYMAYTSNRNENLALEKDIRSIKDSGLRKKTLERYKQGELGRNLLGGARVVGGAVTGGLVGGLTGTQLGAYVAHQRRGGKAAARQDVDYIADNSIKMANEDQKKYQREQFYKAYGRYPEE